MKACFSCGAKCLVTWPYFVRAGSTFIERHFCYRCEREYREAKAQRTSVSPPVIVPASKPQRRKPESLPFALQLDGAKR
jgi:hypothetical protein